MNAAGGKGGGTAGADLLTRRDEILLEILHSLLVKNVINSSAVKLVETDILELCNRCRITAHFDFALTTELLIACDKKFFRASLTDFSMTLPALRHSL